MGKMRLNNMEFYAYHGCLASEKEIGNKFRVDFECEYPMYRSVHSDLLDDAVNYAEVFNIIKREMAISSNLLENVAFRILYAIKSHFPIITSASITVAKYNPPVDGKIESSSITLSY